MHTDEYSSHKNTIPPLSISNGNQHLILDEHVKSHIDKSVENITEKAAFKYVLLILAACALILFGIIWGAIWEMNSKISRTEGLLSEQTPYTEIIKMKLNELEKKNNTLLRQQFCLIKKKSSIQGCLYDN